MLIRSQDKKTIIPLGNFTIGITLDNYVCATSNICVQPSEISAGVIGKYSTEEKAVKVLDMIQNEYKIELYKNKVFEMPDDNEVII